ncbi:MAG: Gfo/Idh/MocA family oxidoreductase [Opitutaceae bacterium]|nr:Gfo/Idh/MocA family oxidoreductase [Opitutaceae bacterium]
MKKYNVGIIGYGWASTAHIQAINATPQAQVVAVYSSRPQDSDALSARYGGRIETYTDLGAMLRRTDMQVVSVCSLPSQHPTQVIAAARAGKHVIIEKPISLNLADALAVGEAIRAAGVRSCVCFEARFSSQFLATKAVIDAGLLGDIHYAEVDYYHGVGPWYGQFRWNTARSNGGSSLLSAGCHALDALLLCMGGNVVTVSSHATGSRNKDFKKYEYGTTSVTILKFDDGRIGKVASVIDCLQPYYFHTHLVGSEGSLLDNRFHSERLGGLNRHAWSSLSMKLLDSGDVSDHPYQRQFEAFFTAIDRGEEMPLTGFQEALVSHRLILAADRSAETGSEVRMDRFA